MLRPALPSPRGRGATPDPVHRLKDDPRVMGAATAKIWLMGGFLVSLEELEDAIDETLELIAAELGGG